MTKDTEQEFLHLVVPGSTTACWLRSGQHDQDLRPIFRGEKAYRLMYELRFGDIPAGFDLHDKCENSACVNPRHLVALSPEDHRLVHATKDRVVKEQIYRGEFQKIQAAKAEAARLERQRLERLRVEEERQREAERREAERQRLLRERQQEAEQLAEQKRQSRRELFDRLFPNLRNHQRLLEQAIKSDEAFDPLRLACLRGELSRNHVQYTGRYDDKIPTLLRSPKPDAVDLVWVIVKDFFHRGPPIIARLLILLLVLLLYLFLVVLSSVRHH